MGIGDARSVVIPEVAKLTPGHIFSSQTQMGEVENVVP